VNRRLQLSHAAEHAPANPLFGDVAEEAFDPVDLRRRGRREVQMKPRVLGQPVLDVRMLVGGVVIDDQMDRQVLVRLPVQLPHKAKELIMAVLRQALADDRAGLDIQRREQGRRAVGLVVVVE